ncbi:MAG: TatD family hydrolase [Pseudomonadota bacterium]|nr:TatD family hydrolase [Pseudomonadota bacterium]
MWIDTHCHLDAPEFAADRDAVAARAAGCGVSQIVLPAVAVSNFETVRQLAGRYGHFYALGIHPLCVDGAADSDLERLREALQRAVGSEPRDPRLVAVGEIGLDHFVPGSDRDKQARFCLAQLRLAREFDLPVILHSRRAVDTLLKQLRQTRPRGGIAHAFNGSEQQAKEFAALGFKLGFGGALTFDRALQIRRLARTVPLQTVVLETDAPDIPPQWLYRTAADRSAGAQARNEPAELPRIATTLAELRGLPLAELARITGANARAALPGLDRCG